MNYLLRSIPLPCCFHFSCFTSVLRVPFSFLPGDESKANSAGNRRPRVGVYQTSYDLVAGEYTIGSFSEGQVYFLYILILRKRLPYTRKCIYELGARWVSKCQEL